eukprot:7384347-Prymnesium_polylepis.1
MGFGFAMHPTGWWYVMAFACLWYTSCLLTLGHMFSSNLLMLQTASILYGVLSMCYVALKRLNYLLRSDFEHELESQSRRLAAAEERASTAVDEAKETASRVQQEIAGYVFHELRNDMNATQGALDWISQDVDDGNATLPIATLAVLREGGVHAQHAIQVINNVMEFSKLQARKFSVPSEPFMLDNLCSVMRLVRHLVRSKPVVLHCTGLPNVRVVGSEFHLKQVLLNLMTSKTAALELTPKRAARKLTTAASILCTIGQRLRVDLHRCRCVQAYRERERDVILGEG